MKDKKVHLLLPPTNIIVVVVSTAIVFFLLAFGGKALESYRLQRYNAMLRTEVTALREQQKQLEARLNYVQTPEYVEKVAREQYRWVKIGEKLVVPIFRIQPNELEHPTPAVRPTLAAGPAHGVAASHWSEWWHLLFD